VIALIAYDLRDLLRSQRWVAPVAALFIMLGIFYSGPPGPARDGYAATAVALFVIAAWITVALTGAEDPVQAQITAVHAGRWWRPLAAKLAAALIASVVLAFVAVLAPVVFRTVHPSANPGDVLVGALAMLAAVVPGVALGAVFSPPGVRSPGTAVLGVVAGVVFTLVRLGVEQSAPPLAALLPPILDVAKIVDGSAGAPGSLLVALEIAVLSAIGVTVSLMLARARD
jgi:hypothetical protein